jgi:hypothetical protein
MRDIADKDRGPAAYRDITQYCHERALQREDDAGRVAFEALILPQFEGVDEDDGRKLLMTVGKIVGPSYRPVFSAGATDRPWLGTRTSRRLRIDATRIGTVETARHRRAVLGIERLAPTPRAVRQGESGRHGRRYGRVLNLYLKRRDLVERSDPSAIREVVEHHALVVADDPMLFEAACTFVCDALASIRQ